MMLEWDKTPPTAMVEVALLTHFMTMFQASLWQLQTRLAVLKDNIHQMLDNNLHFKRNFLRNIRVDKMVWETEIKMSH
jgi:hypothetical protein